MSTNTAKITWHRDDLGGYAAEIKHRIYQIVKETEAVHQSVKGYPWEVTAHGPWEYIASFRTLNEAKKFVAAYSQNGCVGCGGMVPNNLEPGAYPGSLSRYDNETEICSSCGTEEAVFQHYENKPLTAPGLKGLHY